MAAALPGLVSTHTVIRLSMGYRFGGFNPQVPIPEPAGSGNPKAGYLAQPQPTDAGLDFGRHGYLPWVPRFQYYLAIARIALLIFP